MPRRFPINPDTFSDVLDAAHYLVLKSRSSQMWVAKKFKINAIILIYRRIFAAFTGARKYLKLI